MSYPIPPIGLACSTLHTPLLIPTLTSTPQSMPELQNSIPRIKRHIFNIVFHRGRAPRQVKRQFALWLRNAKDNIEESVSRVAVVTKVRSHAQQSPESQQDG
jgi:hypothetical protein